MFKVVIKLFGLPQEITDLKEVEVELEVGAIMAEVIAAMKAKIPELEGTVIRTGENRLIELYKFNVNGGFYFDGMDFQIKEGDSVALLVPAIGG